MALLSATTQLPPDLLSYIQQSRNRNPPAVPIRALRFFANRLPTSFLSDTAHRLINCVGDVVFWDNKLTDEYNQERWRKRREQQLLRDMANAKTLLEYESITMQLDALQGHDKWKAQRESIEPGYDPAIIEAHLEKLQTAANEKDLAAMLHLLRTSLSRDLGGMSMLRLYKHSWFGTKQLIDNYINVAVETIDRFLEVTAEYNLSTAEASRYQSSLEDALKYFGRSALTLSGGSILGMKHVGVVKALWDAELLPEIISGASAGSIVAAIVAASTDEEMDWALEHFTKSDLAVFDTPGTSRLGWYLARVSTALAKWERRWIEVPWRLWFDAVWFDIANLERVMKSWLKDLTFREAHYKTGRVLNVCVSSMKSSEPRIMNYITAPDVYIWSAVCASCSVPGVFEAATIYEKDPATRGRKVWMQNSQQKFVDGSLDHDIPMRKLSEMFNVNCFLVSQVNPHVRCFLEPEVRFDGVQPTTQAPEPGLERRILGGLKNEIAFQAQMAVDLGLPLQPLWRLGSVLNQEYTGNINILPDIHYRREIPVLMANPDPKYMYQATDDGEKATWPKICRIRNSVAIELALIKAINELRERVNFSPEARAARQAARGAGRGRSRSARGRKPDFLRRRSLSNDYSSMTLTEAPAEGPPSPLPMRVIRRNVSVGSLQERLGRMTSKELAPQAGVTEASSNQASEENLFITVRAPKSGSYEASALLRDGSEMSLEIDQPLSGDSSVTNGEANFQDLGS